MTDEACRRLRWITAAAGAFLGCLTLPVQFFLTLEMSRAFGASVGGALVFFLSFYTILTNGFLALCYLAILSESEAAIVRFFRSPRIQSAALASILLVAIVYVGILEAMWTPTGLMRASDVSLHYVAPALFTLYWLFLVKKGRTSYADLPRWLIFPVSYLVYVMLQGALTGFYPYPIVDARLLGYPIALLNIALLIVLYLAVAGIIVTVDRFMGRLADPADDKGG